MTYGTSVSKIENDMYIDSIGIILKLIQIIGSGAAGVWTEWIFKNNKASIHECNIFMYTYGIAMNYILYLCCKPEQHLTLTEGYNIYTWCFIVNQGCLGILVSMVIIIVLRRGYALVTKNSHRGFFFTHYTPMGVKYFTHQWV